MAKEQKLTSTRRVIVVESVDASGDQEFVDAFNRYLKRVNDRLIHERVGGGGRSGIWSPTKVLEFDGGAMVVMYPFWSNSSQFSVLADPGAAEICGITREDTVYDGQQAQELEERAEATGLLQTRTNVPNAYVNVYKFHRKKGIAVFVWTPDYTRNSRPAGMFLNGYAQEVLSGV